MEKVKVTQAQADLIKSIKDTDYAINIHGLNKRPDSPLQELTTAKLARALYVGYEVEPEFKVGNWVVDTLNNYTFRIHAVVNHRVVPDWFEGTYDKGNTDESDWIPIGYLRHATPEEIAKEKDRRWWRKHGRKPWELMPRDVLIYKRGLREIRVVEKKDIFGEYVTLPNYTAFSKKELRESFEVLCFAEDRKDA